MKKISKIITYNFYLKVIALLLAVNTWSYVYNEIEKTTVKDVAPVVKRFPLIGQMITKKLPVKAIFVGEPPEGYIFVSQDVKIDPDNVILAGPKDIMSDVEKLETRPIELTKIKKTGIYETEIMSFSPGVETKNITVKVTVPIKKIDADTEPQSVK